MVIVIVRDIRTKRVISINGASVSTSDAVNARCIKGNQCRTLGEADEQMAVMETCKDCDRKKQRYCRSRSISKNSHICRLVQRNDFKTAKMKIGG